MEYMSAFEASEKWGVSLRQVQRLLFDNRIPCAQKYGRAWIIPCSAEKPADLRMRQKPLVNALSADLSHVLAATTIPLPSHNPDMIMDSLAEGRFRLIYEAELSYLRGDFMRVMQCYHKTEGDDAARLRTAPLAIATAISLGDYCSYTKIEDYLKKCSEANRNSEISAIAELSLATAAVSVIAPNMAPGWLIAGDFYALPHQIRPNALYLRAKYFHCISQFDTMLAVAQTALVLSYPERGITTTDIYLRITCAVACHLLTRTDEAKHWLRDAMRLSLPHGFITPFAEVVTSLGGLLEELLEQEYPDWYEKVVGQWKRTWKNWISFHNQFTKDNITLMLSLREYHIALLAARHVPYAKIAKQYCISVGRLKNIMLGIYEKLYISGRDELVKYVF